MINAMKYNIAIDLRYVENKNSGLSVDIEAGITGFSNIDGNLQTKKTDPKILPADEVDPKTKANSIEIEFLDSTGKKKKLIINYR